MGKLNIGDTFYLIGKDRGWVEKRKVYMLNTTEFCSKESFDTFFVEEARGPVRFTDEHRRWTRTLAEAKKVIGYKLKKKADGYYEIYEDND